jgi:hypothetical protein
MKDGILVLNYIKKHKCRIRLRWYCSVRVCRVWKDDRELLYPRLNEDIWCEISAYFDREGNYQHTHFYTLKHTAPDGK